MNPKEAIQSYLFAERAKTNLITLSQMTTILSDLKGAEKSGAKRMFKLLVNAVAQDLTFAEKSTGSKEFLDAVKILDGIESMLDNDEFDDVSRAIGNAMTQATTPAQQGWQVLSENELV